MLVKKMVVLLLIFSLMFALFGCKSKEAKKLISEGDQLRLSGDTTSAMAKYKEALGIINQMSMGKDKYYLKTYYKMGLALEKSDPDQAFNYFLTAIGSIKNIAGYTSNEDMNGAISKIEQKDPNLEKASQYKINIGEFHVQKSRYMRGQAGADEYAKGMIYIHGKQKAVAEVAGLYAKWIAQEKRDKYEYEYCKGRVDAIYAEKNFDDLLHIGADPNTEEEIERLRYWNDKIEDARSEMNYQGRQWENAKSNKAAYKLYYDTISAKTGITVNIQNLVNILDNQYKGTGIAKLRDDVMAAYQKFLKTKSKEDLADYKTKAAAYEKAKKELASKK